ncbi:MAG TPA: transporter substrate-binding domain-containing protein [Solirubrobacter sp.]|nr:transporter substrate-binding domain-containing protein [Solirubrobacter sp.]
MFTKARGVAAVFLGVAVLALGSCGDDEEEPSGSSSGATSEESAASDSGLKPINEGQLTVGMNLQFKPQMYLEGGEPAGYDVELLKLLAPDTGAELNIQNLAFDGLIPGLQTGKFDMVSVGLSATEERKKVVDFTRGYVPYAQVLAVPADKAASVTSPDALNSKDMTITALQGSTAETLAKETFPEAKVTGFPDQNAAFLEVATGRADGIVVENYLLAQFDASNPDKLAEAELGEPLHVEYGSWAVPKGNEEFVAFLDKWLCEKQTDGTLEATYKKVFEVDSMPPMPEC